jgi:hypothetical protein
VLSVVVTVFEFKLNGKCPGQLQQQEISPQNEYEKAIIDYATLQEGKVQRRLNETRMLIKEVADEELAENNSRRLVREINARNMSWRARFNPSATG